MNKLFETNCGFETREELTAYLKQLDREANERAEYIFKRTTELIEKSDIEQMI